jgi:hypothetical protein
VRDGCVGRDLTAIEVNNAVLSFQMRTWSAPQASAATAIGDRGAVIDGA